MMVQGSQKSKQINYDELATLKQLAKMGALTKEVKISLSSLAEALDISGQTVSRRLDKLWEMDFINQQPASDGRYVFIRDGGYELLNGEYQEYHEILGDDVEIELRGRVVAGDGKAKHFLSLSGYQTQFRDQLGYDPYPGTLNVELDPESTRTRLRMADTEPIYIDGWEDGDQSYGPVYCYPARVKTVKQMYSPCHAITPERTDHGQEKLELLAPERLRDGLDLDSGNNVTVYIQRE